MAIKKCKFRDLSNNICNAISYNIRPISIVEEELHCQCCNTCMMQETLFSNKDKVEKLIEVMNIIDWQGSFDDVNEKHLSEEDYITNAISTMDNDSFDICDIHSIIRDAFAIELLKLNKINFFLSNNLEWYFCGLMFIVLDKCKLKDKIPDTVYIEYYKISQESKQYWNEEIILKYNTLVSSYTDWKDFTDESRRHRKRH